MTQQIINDNLPYTQAVAIGGQTIFATNPAWTANQASDVVVYYTPNGQSPNDLTQLLATNLYTVQFIGGNNTVQITLVNPASSGDLITIVRNTPADFLNLYTNTNFTPSMLNNDFGIMTFVDQQAQLVNQQIAPHYNFSALINQGGPGADIYLPILGPNQVWMKNEANNAIVAVDFELPSGGGGINSWQTISSTTQAASGEGFVTANASSRVVVNLPTTFNVGDEVAIMGSALGGWTLVAGASQQIVCGSVVSSFAGNVESDLQYSNIFVRALNSTQWAVVSINTNPTFN